MPTVTCASCAVEFEIEGMSGTCARCGAAVKADLSVRVICSCGTTIKAPHTLRGRVIRCPRCTKSVPIPKGDEEEQAKATTIAGHVLRWAFAATLIPLIVAMNDTDEGTRKRLKQSLAKLPAKSEEREAAEAASKLKDQVAFLPDRKAGSAHLPQGSKAPVVYGLLALGGLVGFAGIAFRSKFASVTGAAGGAGVGAVVGGITGILVPTLFPDPVEAPGGGRTWMIAAVLALLAEAFKSMPATRALRSGRPQHATSVALVGIVAGLAYGAAESMALAFTWMNGISLQGAYVIRFVSAVGLQGALGGLSALLLWRWRGKVRQDSWTGTWLQAVGTAASLHMIFEGLLRTGHQTGALVTGLAAFGAFHALHWIEEASEETAEGPQTLRV